MFVQSVPHRLIATLDGITFGNNANKLCNMHAKK